MPNITINGKEYDLDKLSDNAKGQLSSLRIADQKIAQLQAEIALVQTARNAYARMVQKELEGVEPESGN
ncbi:MAG: DUF6447 family protein [Gammaproteobacteria bacterium]|nr:hypothetical protein [Pseudomonadales bacterium]MCP5347814.1 hypothetical protein [Pseudomonadales bacterium]